MIKGRRHAVLIGSSRFDKEPALNPLRCPERDVDGMREILVAAELGAFEDPFVFKNADSYVVMHKIEEILSEAAGNDQLLIYYSGHGKMDLPGRLYLATTNTEVRKLATTSIPVEMLRLLIENSSCRKIMLILDCCFGGAAGKSFINIRGGIDERLQELARGNGVYILTAATASQTAQERDNDDYGLMTKHIISGIRQGDADADNDGLVSMDDLYQYVHAKVKSEGYQEPMRWALNVKGEELIIARAGKNSSREQHKLLTQKVIEIRAFLPPHIFGRIIQVIQERRGPLYGLVNELCCERLQVGEFIEEWYRIESAGQVQSLGVLPDLSHSQTMAVEKVEVVKDHKQLSQKTQTKSELTEHGSLTSASTNQTNSPDSQPRSTASLRLLIALINKHRFMSGSLMAIAVMAITFIFLSGLRSCNETGNQDNALFSTPPISLTALSYTNFETVTLDSHGKETPSRTLKVEYFSENLDGVRLDMVKIPGGRFMMGSPENEAERSGMEGPQHSVRVPDFFIGRFEITREQWRQITRMPKVNIDLQEDPSYFKDAWRQPVEQVSWDEVVEFCKRLEKKTGNPYRLPTEAEWEYAARAVTITPFAFGGTITSKLVNYDSNYPYGLAVKGVYIGKTVDVGSLGKANAFGLFDMHGNVWEWCADVWHNSYGKEHGDAPTNGTAWITGGEQDKHVLRGGSWNSDGISCRSASRFRGGAGDRLNLNGFRVACQVKMR